MDRLNLHLVIISVCFPRKLGKTQEIKILNLIFYVIFGLRFQKMKKLDLNNTNGSDFAPRGI